MDFITYETRKARKQHTCDACDHPIEKGTEYTYKAWKYCGELYQEKLCKECESVIDEYLNDCGENEYNYDEVADYWVETKCRNCRKYYDDCSYDPETCEAESAEKCTCRICGKCSELDRECDSERTHYIRCENWESFDD